MIELPFMPIAVGDILAESGGLTTEEFGAYMRILMHMWVRGGQLPFDHQTLRQIAGVSSAKWKRIEPRIRSHFDKCGTPHGSQITNRSLVRQYEHVQEKRTKAAINGRLGGKKTALNRLGGLPSIAAPKGSPNGYQNAGGSAAGASALKPKPIEKESLEEKHSATRARNDPSAGPQSLTGGSVDRNAPEEVAGSENDSLVSDPDRLLRSLNHLSQRRKGRP